MADIPLQEAGVCQVALLLPLPLTPAEPLGPGKPLVLPEVSCYCLHAQPRDLAIEVRLPAIEIFWNPLAIFDYLPVLFLYDLNSPS